MASKNEKSLFIKIGGKVAESLGRSVNIAENKLGKIEKAAKTVGKITAVGLAAAGTAAVALGKEIYDLSTDYSKGINQLNASLGLTAEESKEYGEIIKNIYGDNFGENFEEIAGNIALVKEQMGDIPLEEIEAATESAYLLDDVFAIDLQESIRGADAMMEHLGVTAEEAYNLMAQGAEKGLNQNGDLADQLAEYSVYYGNLGFTAEETMNIMAAGAESGVYQIDKLNDAVKEFSIRSIDGSSSTAEAFEALGLNADEMAQIFAGGGEASALAFDEVVDRLGEIDDAVLQDAIGVSLFGTMWEDVGAEGVLALGNVQDEIDLTRDKLAEMNEVKYDDLGSMFEGLKRSVELLLLPLGEQLIPVIQDLVTEIQPLITDTLNGLVPILLQLISDLLPPIIDLVKQILPLATDIINAVLPILIDLIAEIVPIAMQIIDAILPVMIELLSALMPVIEPILDILLELLNSVLLPIIDALSTVVGWIADGLTWLVEAFMSGDTSAAAKSAANVATYAQGGWAYEPSIFGEAGPEVAISFDPAYRKENIGYWQEAGYLLGVFDGGSGGAQKNTAEVINYFDSEPVMSDGDSGSVTIVFSPQFTFNGSATEENVQDIVEEAYQRFKTFMARFAKENRRIRFEV